MKKNIICLPSIELGFSNIQYKEIAYNAINKIYDMLANHPLFISQIECTYNSREDVYLIFSEHVLNFMIITYGDFSNDKHLLTYNLLSDNTNFFNTWKKELFEYIINNH